MRAQEKVQIRKMEERDADTVAVLATELGYPSNASEVRERLKKIWESDHEHVFVLEVDHALLGFAHAGEELSMTGHSRMFLRSLVISKKARGQKRGVEFIQFLEKFSVERGFRHLRIGSEIGRADAHRFYEKLGYPTLKISRLFERKLV